MPPLPSSIALVGRAKAGDQQAFLGLYEMHGKQIYSLSLRLTGSIPAAEDFTRDTFTLAFSTLEAIYDDATFAGWLYYCAAKAMSARKAVDSGSLSAGMGSPEQDV
jgi:DNA-directed RNA polymerase specialized sigma24 family protein